MNKSRLSAVTYRYMIWSESEINHIIKVSTYEITAALGDIN